MEHRASVGPGRPGSSRPLVTVGFERHNRRVMHDDNRHIAGDEVAPDGSPVDLYDHWLPPNGEAELVDGAIAAGAAVLELGCGAGRVTRRLLALGHPVVAVDESPTMLARLAEDAMLQTVCLSVGDLDLGRTFPAVLLGSHLVNTADDARRRSLLQACRRHLDEGTLFIERLDPRWAELSWAEATAARAGLVGDVMVSSHGLRLDPPYLTQSTEYALPDGRRWRQGPYTMIVLDDVALARELELCGLVLERRLPWQGSDQIWWSARAAAPGRRPDVANPRRAGPLPDQP